MTASSTRGGAFGKLFGLLRPEAKRVIFRSFVPGPQTRGLYAGLFQADFFTREMLE